MSTSKADLKQEQRWGLKGKVGDVIFIYQNLPLNLKIWQYIRKYKVESFHPIDVPV